MAAAAMRATEDNTAQEGLSDWLEDCVNDITEDILGDWPEGFCYRNDVFPLADSDMLDDLDDAAMDGLLRKPTSPHHDLSPMTLGSSPSTIYMGQTPENDVDWEPGQSVIASSAITEYSAIGDVTDSHKLLNDYQNLPSTKQLATDERGSARILPPNFRLRPFRTFLHLKDLAVTKSEMFRHSTTTVFEVFARATYSYRENFNRKQYFQFGDLFAEPSSYMSGVLPDWDPSGEVEWAADQFLMPNDPGLKCYCQCLLVPEPRSELGWSAVIKDIRPTTWKEIRIVEDHLELSIT